MNSTLESPSAWRVARGGGGGGGHADERLVHGQVRLALVAASHLAALRRCEKLVVLHEEPKVRAVISMMIWVLESVKGVSWSLERISQEHPARAAVPRLQHQILAPRPSTHRGYLCLFLFTTACRN